MIARTFLLTGATTALGRAVASRLEHVGRVIGVRAQHEPAANGGAAVDHVANLKRAADVRKVVLGLAAALLTRRIVRFRGFWRSIFILPWTMPAIVAAMVWGVMYDSNFGILNQLLRMLPFVNGNVEWLLNSSIVLPALVVVQVWNEFPVAYIFFLAALHAIPEELYEAASVDGASPFQQFLFVTLPQIKYVLAVIVVLLLIFGFRAFPVIFLLTGGRTETLTVATFNAAFRTYDFSYAATLGVLAMAVSLVLVLVYLKLALRHGKAEAAS
jgi:multiple sugar transport system permease protein